MNLPPVLFGIETEIGIIRDDDPKTGAMTKSRIP
jgi:hypothetical protein